MYRGKSHFNLQLLYCKEGNENVLSDYFFVEMHYLLQKRSLKKTFTVFLFSMWQHTFCTNVWFMHTFIHKIAKSCFSMKCKSEKKCNWNAKSVLLSRSCVPNDSGKVQTLTCLTPERKSRLLPLYFKMNQFF